MQREAMLSVLGEREFDLLVIGGGATGAGAALDAATRGLSVALVERADFSSGTSSRSTKLIHGGVRYLEQAVKKLDRGQLHLVREALRERAVLLRIAPHLTRPLPLLTPLYHWFEVPYMYTGLKMYELLAGKANLAPSAYVGRRRALERYPMLQSKGLRGGVLYYDGQFDDARMNVALALTAAEQGATVANYVEVEELTKEAGRLSGAVVRDKLGGSAITVRARAVINATGPFSDAVRLLDDPAAEPMLSVSSGVHIVLDRRFAPPDTGLLIPRTQDGRVLFVLPWQGHTLIGTTDESAPLEDDPQASEREIEYLLEHVRNYFDLPVGRDDVLSAWSGLRPLVAQGAGEGTAALSRDHVIVTSESGLVTITGGKWTTYRRMAEDAVDRAVEVAGLEPLRGSGTFDLPLHGGAGFRRDRPEPLPGDLDDDIATHLRHAYGDRAPAVAALAAEGLAERLAPGHPFIEAEVVYGARHELACTVRDVLDHRTRLSFLDEAAALAAEPRVRELLEAAHTPA